MKLVPVWGTDEGASTATPLSHWHAVCGSACAWLRSIAAPLSHGHDVIWGSYEIWGHWSLVWLGTWQVFLTHSAEKNAPTVVISICFPLGNFPPQCLSGKLPSCECFIHRPSVTSLRFHRRSPSFILYKDIALQRNPIWRFLNHCYHQATGSTAKEQQHAYKLHTTTWSLSLFLLISLAEP